MCCSLLWWFCSCAAGSEYGTGDWRTWFTWIVTALYPQHRMLLLLPLFLLNCAIVKLVIQVSSSCKDSWSLSNLSLLVCESCMLGKHTHAASPKRVYKKATSIYEIVHSNYGVQIVLVLPQGFYSFLPQCTLFLMESRFELFSIYWKFNAEIRNQFGISIKKLINDNAR